MSGIFARISIMYAIELCVFLVSASVLLIALSLLLSLMWTTVMGGVPYLATDKERVKDMIILANVKPGEKTVDLGSGDGRIVIAMAKKGAIAHGFELNFFYVILSRYNIWKAGLHGRVHIYWKNFWTVDLSCYDVVTAFAISYLMPKLEKKLKKEIKITTRVITTTYAFKTWKYIKRKDFAFLYKRED